MNCSEFEKSLNSLLAGGLPREEAEIIRLHLARCPDCRMRLDPVDRIEMLPALDETVEPSPHIGARFHSRLINHRSQTSIGSRRRILEYVLARWRSGRLAAAALAAIVIIGAVLVGPRLWQPRDQEAVGRDLAIAENLPLLEDMDVVSNLDLLEDFEEIQAMSQDSGTGH